VEWFYLPWESLQKFDYYEGYQYTYHMEKTHLESSFDWFIGHYEFTPSTKTTLEQLHQDICDHLLVRDTTLIKGLLDQMKQSLTLEQSQSWQFLHYEQELQAIITQKEQEEHAIVEAFEESLHEHQQDLAASKPEEKKSWLMGRFKDTTQQISDFFDNTTTMFWVSFASISSFLPEKIWSPLKTTVQQIKDWGIGIYETIMWFFWWNKKTDDETPSNNKQADDQEDTTTPRTREQIVDKYQTQTTIEYNPAIKYTKDQYFTMIWPLALEIEEKFRIPASIVAAQSALESWYGNSWLARRWYNFFWCTKWTSREYETIWLVDNWAWHRAQFRKYICPEESFFDYATLLANAPRYASLFPKDRALSYQERAYWLKEAWYASDPTYPQKLISIIEKNGLDRKSRWDVV
jgi:flagellum-specific peptidoglycan hydrolase FlgJ